MDTPKNSPQPIVFVYAKETNVRVLGLEELGLDSVVADILINEGYVHTASLGACSFIESLANEKDDAEIVRRVRELSKQIRY